MSLAVSDASLKFIFDVASVINLLTHIRDPNLDSHHLSIQGKGIAWCRKSSDRTTKKTQTEMWSTLCFLFLGIVLVTSLRL